MLRLTEKDLQEGYPFQVESRASNDCTKNKIENNFDNLQKGAALTSSVRYNGIKSQNDLGCGLQAKEGVLV